MKSATTKKLYSSYCLPDIHTGRTDIVFPRVWPAYAASDWTDLRRNGCIDHRDIGCLRASFPDVVSGPWVSLQHNRIGRKSI